VCGAAVVQVQGVWRCRACAGLRDLARGVPVCVLVMCVRGVNGVRGVPDEMHVRLYDNACAIVPVCVLVRACVWSVLYACLYMVTPTSVVCGDGVQVA